MLHLPTLLFPLLLAQSSPPVLEPGVPTVGSLVATDPGLSYVVLPAGSREIAISLVSGDFDARLSVSSVRSGVREFDGGGFDSNAFARVAQHADECLYLRVEASDASRGEFEIRVVPASPVADDGRLAVQFAREAYERAASRALEKGEHARAVKCLAVQGSLLDRHGPLTEARVAYRRMLDAATRAGSNTSILRARMHLASLDLLFGDVENALAESDCLEEETRDGADDELRAFVLRLRGFAASTVGDHEVARASHEEEVWRARAAGSAPLECRALCALAGVKAFDTQPPTAQTLLQRALEIAQECDDDVLGANVWLAFGQNEAAYGESRKACDALQRALELDPDLPTRINILGALGSELFELGDFVEARRRFTESLELARTAGLGSCDPQYLLVFGNLEIASGNLDIAVALLERARDAWPGGLRARGRAETLLSLAQARSMRGGSEDENAVVEDARAVLDLGRETDDLRLQVYAVILLCNGAPSNGPVAPELRRTLEELAERAAASSEIVVAAKALAQLAWDDFLSGNFAKAVRDGNRAADRFAALGEDEQCLFVLETVARAASSASDEDALAVAVDRIARILDRDDRVASQESRPVAMLRYLAMLEPYEHDLLALRMRMAGPSGEVRQRLLAAGFEQSERWKMRSPIESLIRRRAASPRPDEAWLVARAAWIESGRRFRTLADRGAPAAEVAESYLATTALLKQLEDLERDAQTRERSERAVIEPQARSARAVQSLLATGDALIEFVAGTRDLYAYLLTADRLELVSLGPRAPIERDARAFARLLATDSLPDDAPRGTPLGLEGIVQLGSRLHATLLTGALDFFGPSAEQLVIVPTRELSELPFEALIDASRPRGADRRRFSELAYVVRRHAVTYAPSASALFEIVAAGPKARARTVLVLADPDYAGGGPVRALLAEASGRAAQGDPEHEALEPLRHTRSEAADIASLIAGWTQPMRPEDAVAIQEIRSGRRDTLRSVDGFELYLGREASADRLRSEAGRFSIVHVGAHGLRGRPGFPEPALVLARDDRGNSGVVTSDDVLALDLDADLVVLAACHSAERATLDGEGVQSLARAFLRAGARGVIATLWEARDLEARELMKAFYTEHLKSGLRPAQALRRAKLAAIEGSKSRGLAPANGEPQRRFSDASDPYYWAGFVYCGLAR